MTKIAHASNADGVYPFCGNAHAAVIRTVDQFLNEPRQCKRCAAKVYSINKLQAKRDRQAKQAEPTQHAVQLMTLPTERTLIIHINRYSRQIAGGYVAEHGTKRTTNLTQAGVALMLTQEPNIRIEALYV